MDGRRGLLKRHCGVCHLMGPWPAKSSTGHCLWLRDSTTHGSCKSWRKSVGCIVSASSFRTNLVSAARLRLTFCVVRRGLLAWVISSMTRRCSMWVWRSSRLSWMCAVAANASEARAGEGTNLYPPAVPKLLGNDSSCNGWECFTCWCESHPEKVCLHFCHQGLCLLPWRWCHWGSCLQDFNGWGGLLDCWGKGSLWQVSSWKEQLWLSMSSSRRCRTKGQMPDTMPGYKRKVSKRKGKARFTVTKTLCFRNFSHHTHSVL